MMRRCLVCWLGALGCVADVPSPDVEVAEDPSDVQVAPELRLHRLTTRQLVRSVDDLLGVDLRGLDLLPADPVGAGFDNTEASLTLATSLIEQWRDAAEMAARRAVSPASMNRTWLPDHPELGLQRRGVGPDPGVDPPPLWDDDGAALLDDVDEIELVFTTPTDGDYLLTFDADVLTSFDPAPFELVVEVDGRDVVLLSRPEPAEWGERVHEASLTDLAAGPHVVRYVYRPSLTWSEPAGFRFRSIRVSGPTVPPESMPADGWVSCSPGDDEDDSAWSACARTVLEPVLRRGWRRPVDVAVLDEMVSLVLTVRATERPFHEGLRVAVERLLMSPHFFFRIEDGGEVGSTVDEHELASRLAFFLWSSLPDQALLERADRGELSDPEVLEQEVYRMLGDPRADGLVDDFAGQWLLFADFDQVRLDAELFPMFDAAARDAMKHETRQLARRLITGEIALPELLTTTTSSIVAPLDSVYGVAAGEHVDVGRPGFLGHGVLHASTSKTTRSSVVHRGMWVLNHLLCEPVGAPPAVSEDLGDDPLDGIAGRAGNPQCAACHQRIDPLGLALEHYDPVGQWRQTWPSGERVDATAMLPNGDTLYGATELGGLISQDERFPHCATTRFATWAYGRGAETLDPAMIGDVHEAFRAGEFRFPALAVAIATHPQFRVRLEPL